VVPPPRRIQAHVTRQTACAGKGRRCRSDQESSLTIRSVAGIHQSRTDDGTALGCVVPRRPCALGYRPAAATNSAFGIRRRIRRSGARCGLRNRRDTLHIAALGLSVLGVDVAETALAIAKKKADDRGIEVEFAAADAFELQRLGRRFETVLDCGLFHSFDRDERPAYVASLASVTEHDGTLYVLCFSDDGPDTGPTPSVRKS